MEGCSWTCWNRTEGERKGAGVGTSYARKHGLWTRNKCKENPIILQRISSDSSAR